MPYVSIRSLLTAAFLAGLVATAATLGLPDQSLAYRSTEAHVAMETVATFVAGLAALLAYGRATRTHSLGDAILATALLLLVLANGAYALAPLLAGYEPARFTTWAPLAVRALAAVGLLAAALATERRVVQPHRTLAGLLSAGLAAFALAGIVVGLLGNRLPAAVEIERDAGGTVITAAPALAVVLILMTLITGAAALAFARAHGRAEARGGDDWRAWLAAGVLLSAFSKLNQVVSPTVFTDYVSISDGLRLSFYVVLLVGAVREITAYQAGMAEAAVVLERRRMARDLHDGLAQELAYLTAQARRLKRQGENRDRIDAMLRSAERALGESRVAISALHQPTDGPLGEALAAMAADAGRGQLAVDLDEQHEHDVDAGAREALLRIVAEAAGNAVRHGGAQRLRITLDGEEGLLLRLEDDGRGFDLSAPARPDAYGVRGMRERAEELGGDLRVDSAPDTGTTIEVRLP